MFLIQLSNLKGVEMITAALRSTGNLADQDLADGIDKHLIHIDEKGAISHYSEQKPTKPALSLVQ